VCQGDGPLGDLEGRVAPQHDEEHDAGGPDIGLGAVVLLVCGNLGGGVQPRTRTPSAPAPKGPRGSPLGRSPRSAHEQAGSNRSLPPPKRCLFGGCRLVRTLSWYLSSSSRSRAWCRGGRCPARGSTAQPTNTLVSLAMKGQVQARHTSSPPGALRGAAGTRCGRRSRRRSR
jgi:hypothetical protein